MQDGREVKVILSALWLPFRQPASLQEISKTEIFDKVFEGHKVVCRHDFGFEGVPVVQQPRAGKNFSLGAVSPVCALLLEGGGRQEY